ncbi:hypothetical protein Q8W71_00045 [Methylobacterium sp. NEAU 140]|uniref:hypothetical protein n=1 Tax=Methylobacterium sp. NEAU 140 TaxID=3064945 RepID=UPI0027360672|nr:hypothetical protein [Methylobacterium sp. NEAU 140]MDP4021001.1 hypothetical protein [Methylobacterium sp. NEAU 140]
MGGAETVGDETEVNPVALFTMFAFMAGWLVLAGLTAFSGRFALLLLLLLATLALFFYVPWVRLRAGAIQRPGLPTRIWVNGAMVAVCLATCAALGWAIIRRIGG